MSESDLKTNSKVRKVLVEANLDTTVLSIKTTSGSVLIRGELRKFNGKKMNDNAAVRLLGAVEINIIRSKGVKRVTFKLAEWERKENGSSRIGNRRAAFRCLAAFVVQICYDPRNPKIAS